jgi:hypothetical protein
MDVGRPTNEAIQEFQWMNNACLMLRLNYRSLDVLRRVGFGVSRQVAPCAYRPLLRRSGCLWAGQVLRQSPSCTFQPGQSWEDAYCPSTDLRRLCSLLLSPVPIADIGSGWIPQLPWMRRCAFPTALVLHAYILLTFLACILGNGTSKQLLKFYQIAETQESYCTV